MVVREGGDYAANVMEFWDMEGYDVGFLIVVVEVRSILGVDEGSWSCLSGGSFEGASDVNLDIVGPR